MEIHFQSQELMAKVVEDKDLWKGSVDMFIKERDASQREIADLKARVDKLTNVSQTSILDRDNMNKELEVAQAVVEALKAELKAKDLQLDELRDEAKVVSREKTILAFDGQMAREEELKAYLFSVDLLLVNPCRNLVTRSPYEVIAPFASLEIHDLAAP